MSNLAAPPAECQRCTQRGREYFVYHLEGRYDFDVDRARVFTSDGREAVELEEESTRLSLEGCTMDEAHIDHVDPTIPGLIAHVFHTTPEGEELAGHVLIDGNHRAARCLRDGLPFRAYLLTEDESRAILLRAPRPRRRESVYSQAEGQDGKPGED